MGGWISSKLASNTLHSDPSISSACSSDRIPSTYCICRATSLVANIADDDVTVSPVEEVGVLPLEESSPLVAMTTPTLTATTHIVHTIIAVIICFFLPANLAFDVRVASTAARCRCVSSSATTMNCVAILADVDVDL